MQILSNKLLNYHLFISCYSLKYNTVRNIYKLSFKAFSIDHSSSVKENNNEQINKLIDFKNLTRVELQKIAKENKIKANMKTSEIVIALQNMSFKSNNNNDGYHKEKIKVHIKDLNYQPNNTSDLKEFLMIEKSKQSNFNI
jgi:hypothetical protein